MFERLLNPSPSVKQFLGLALDADEDDPQRSAYWRWVYKQANRVVDMYHSIGTRSLVSVEDVLEHWIYSVEDSRMLGDPLLNDMACGFKSINQECADRGFECVSYSDYEKFVDDAWVEDPIDPQEVLLNSREVYVSQVSADIAGRSDRPFLNGMYENTLPEPWSGWKYEGVARRRRI